MRMTKSEKREKIRKNQRKMQVRGRSIFVLQTVIVKTAKEAREWLAAHKALLEKQLTKNKKR